MCELSSKRPKQMFASVMCSDSLSNVKPCQSISGPLQVCMPTFQSNLSNNSHNFSEQEEIFTTNSNTRKFPVAHRRIIPMISNEENTAPSKEQPFSISIKNGTSGSLNHIHGFNPTDGKLAVTDRHGEQECDATPINKKAKVDLSTNRDITVRQPMCTSNQTSHSHQQDHAPAIDTSVSREIWVTILFEVGSFI